MPCRDDYGPSDYSSETESARKEAERNSKRADLAARVACELEKKYIKSAQELETLSEESQKWIAEHRVKDAREKAEKLRAERLAKEARDKEAQKAAFKASALNKLTKEERRALGL